jgi:hypothetical protein
MFGIYEGGITIIFHIWKRKTFLEQVPPVYNAFLISEKSAHHGRLDGDSAPHSLGYISGRFRDAHTGRK